MDFTFQSLRKMSSWNKSWIYLVFAGFLTGLVFFSPVGIRGGGINSSKDWVSLVVPLLGCLISGWCALLVARDQIVFFRRERRTINYEFELTNNQQLTLFPIRGEGKCIIMYSIKREDEWVGSVPILIEMLGGDEGGRHEFGFPFGKEELRVELNEDATWEAGLRIILKSSEARTLKGSIRVTTASVGTAPTFPSTPLKKDELADQPRHA